MILIPVTNAIERLHEEFKRRIKTQTVLPSAETAAMLFWALLASGQIKCARLTAGRRSPQNPAISRLTWLLEAITSSERRSRHPNPNTTPDGIVTRSMTTYAETESRWSRHTDPIAASAPRKMDVDFADMPGAGWSNGSSPGFNGSAAFLSAGSFIRRISSASYSSPASSFSSNDFEIGSSQTPQSRP